MSRKKLSPEVEIMNLFATLNEDGRRIVSDWIKGQMATPRKPKSQQTAGRRVPLNIRASRPAADTVKLPENPEEFKHSAAG